MYHPLATSDDPEEENKRTLVSKFKAQHSKRSNISWDSALDLDDDSAEKPHRVTLVKEKYAEICSSDVDQMSDRDSLTGYANSSGRQDSLRSDIFAAPASPRLQVSLIYNMAKNYIAGKITRIDGVPSREAGGPDQIKVNMVLLPKGRYILKTGYFNVNVSAKLDEYFKMKFKILPPLETTAIRYRVYGRNVKFGMPGREKCLGETCIELTEVARSKGGVTMWKSILPKGLSRTAPYSD